MAPDVHRPNDDPYALVGNAWPSESESSYTAAESKAADASTDASSQAESADDAARQTDSGMQGRTADSVSGGYSHVASQLRQQSTDYTTLSAWMLDASGKVRTAKTSISDLVSAGTSEIRDAINSETAGTPVTPSSTELTSRYRNDIASVASKLTTDLDAIGHSLAGTPGASTTPSYVSVPLTPSVEHPHASAQVVAFNTGQSPAVEPHQLPEMPRATSTPTVELPSTPGTPSAPAIPRAPVNPTLSNLIAGNASPSSSPASPSTSSSSGTTPAGQAHQPTEQHQPTKSPGLPRIPSVPVADIPAAAATITTAVTSAMGSQLPIANTTPATLLASASTGTTPGTSGSSPILPTAPAPLAPIGGLTTPPVVQAPPALQASPASPPPGVPAPTPQVPAPPAPPRGPVADLVWIQKSYGLAPGLDLPKPENPISPVFFIADLPDNEAHLHRVLASIRHQFDASGGSQPLAVATIRRGFEAKTVYVTADALSIHPHGVLLPHGVTPLDEMTVVPSASRLEGSLMVTEKLMALVPRGWDIECLLSTVLGEEVSQSTEQYQALIEGEELLPCTVSRGDSTVTADGALRVFARAAIGSGGCGELDVESARLRGARWIGVQPAGYRDVLARYHLADAAEAMSAGRWGEAAYASEKCLSIRQMKKQVA